jgi:hypothetical protein
MTTDRTARWARLVVAAALAIAAAIPSAAHAGPLLSGYGGPGQGNQAILGSTLIGGGGGPSGGGGSGVSATISSGEASAQPLGSSAAGGRVPQASATAPHRGLLGPRHASSSELVGRTRPNRLARSSYPAVEMTAGTSDTLGLSGSDVLYIILAAVALAFTGVFTKVVARTRTGH